MLDWIGFNLFCILVLISCAFQAITYQVQETYDSSKTLKGDLYQWIPLEAAYIYTLILLLVIQLWARPLKINQDDSLFESVSMVLEAGKCLIMWEQSDCPYPFLILPQYRILNLSVKHKVYNNICITFTNTIQILRVHVI